MPSSEDIEKLKKLKEKLEEELEEVRRREEELREYIKVLDEIISATRFIPAEELIEEAKPSEEAGEVVEKPPLRREAFFRWKGRVYAWIEIYEDRVRIEVNKEFKLPIEDRLVRYLRREMDKYFEEDLIKIENKLLDPSMQFMYLFDEDEGFLTLIEIKDFGIEERRKDLLKKILWVFRTHAKEALPT